MSKDVLVGHSVGAKGTGNYVIPGSVQVMCHDCPAMLWVSPSSWLILAGHPSMDIVCLSCASKRIAVRRQGEVVKVEPRTLAQLEEIAESRRASQ